MLKDLLGSQAKNTKAGEVSWIFYLVGLTLILQDGLRNLTSNSNAQALFTVGILFALIFAAFIQGSLPRQNRVKPRKHMEIVFAFSFVIWAFFRFFDGSREVGVQNIVVWAIFPLTLYIVSNSYLALDRFRLYFLISRFTVFASVIYFLTTAYFYLLGSSSFFYSPRAAGWTFAIALAYIAPIAAANKQFIVVLLPSLCVVISLSRTAVVVVLLSVSVYFLLRMNRGRSFTRAGLLRLAIGLFSFSAVLFWAIFNYSEAIRQRFIGGDNFAIGDLQINTSGRGNIWALVVDSIGQHFWIGAGTGHAQELVTEAFSGLITHPHNEFLRILDDTGVVGLTLWSMPFLIYLFRLARLVSRSSNQIDRVFSFSAFLALIGFLAGCATDNLSVYYFVLFPLAAILGQSLNSDLQNKSSENIFEKVKEKETKSA
jgi:O-antigen ligase